MAATETKTPIAHVDESGAKIHLLEEHLRQVAKMASSFASSIGAAQWAESAGLWHDLGKFGPDFQNYIRTRSGYEAHLGTKFGKFGEIRGKFGNSGQYTQTQFPRTIPNPPTHLQMSRIARPPPTVLDR
jgi:hypothetical protein